MNCIELMPCHEFNELEYFSSSSKYVDSKLILIFHQFYNIQCRSCVYRV
jgi:hypothetical protein